MIKSDWKLNNNFPDLSQAGEICLDTETRDDELKTKGPGVRRGGYMVGVAIATSDGLRNYYPFGHETGEQYDRDNIFRYLSDQLNRPSQPKIGANILYDLDYLTHAGVKVQGPFYDVQVAEPLLDENKGSYSLDNLAKEYLGEEEGKDETMMDIYAREQGWTGKSVKYLWRMPPEYVGQYAEADVDRTIRVWKKQQPKLISEDLGYIFDIETRLIPLLLKMRQHGVKINIDKADQLIEETKKTIDTLTREIEQESGEHVDIWAARSLAVVFDKLGIDYPRTAKTDEPSFTAQWLEKHTHPIANKIREIRKLDKFMGTFLMGQISSLAIGDRLHPQFNQLRGDQYGTVTGRFSCSLPNLQFIPARDPVLGPLTRSLFLPDEHCDWGRADYSQIEIRILAHYARGRGSKSIVSAFINDPGLDLHQWGADLSAISRKFAKTINFGVVYGMGVLLLSKELGESYDRAQSIINNYHAKLPFLKQTTYDAMRIAQGRGYVKTGMGRRRRFNRFEPRDWKLGRSHPELAANSKEEAIQNIKDYIEGLEDKSTPPKTVVQRAGTYKAFNAVDQGTSADIMKKAMVDCYEAGIFDILPCHITVHDELDVSVPRTMEGIEAFEEMGQIMADTFPLKVPVIVDMEKGENWGYCKAFGRSISKSIRKM